MDRPPDAIPTPESFPRTSRYRYVRTLGEGGMGTVYEAFDLEHDHRVALKTVLGRTRTSVDMLVDEFRARRVDHPNLVRLLELTATDEQVFFTMELLEATDLARWVWASDPVRIMSTMGLVPAEFDSALPAGPALVSAARLSPERTEALARICCDLVSALHALHRAGLVHRDVKPGNILVADSSRVVLADFGLATAFRPAPGEPRAYVPVAGTPGYMAPELRGGRPSPASDFYALGATIVHAITGAPPDPRHSGAPFATVCDDRELVELVERMLSEDERVRPGAAELYDRLAASARAPVPGLVEHGLRRSHSLAPHGTHQVFVGRERELATLQQSFDAAERSEVAFVRVQGPSGVGKTTLVNEWLQRNEHVPGLLVLRGHCRLHERLAFGGFDNALKNLRDALLHDLAELARQRAALPRLGTIFPQLTGLVPHEPPAPHGDDKERRNAAFDELRVLLEAMGSRRPLVLWLDDVQWLDRDGRSLLANLTSGGGLLGVMLIASYRTDDECEEPTPQTLIHSTTSPVVELELGGLSRSEVERMVEAHGGDRAQLGSTDLLGLTRGLPIFAELLAHDLGDAISSSDPRDPLSRIIGRTLARLEEPAGLLLSAIVLSPQPLPRELATEVADTHSSAVVLSALEDAGLVRYAAGTERGRLTVFHDRIRSAHLGTLAPGLRQRLHSKIAEVYERRHPDAWEVLTYHHRHAEQRGPAARYAIMAAEGAERTLAFGAAGDYYEQALELRSEQPDDWRLWAKLARARANEGRAETAATTFEHAVGRMGTPPELSSERDGLLTRATAEYLHCGRIHDGYRVLGGLLDRHGLSLPRSHRSSVMRSAWLRGRLVLGGHRLARPGRAPAPQVLERLHVLWTACTGLAHINHVLADVLLLMHLRTALRAGAHEHAFRALTYEAAAEATIGGSFFDRRADSLLDAGRAMLEAWPAADYDRAWYWVSAGARAFFAADWPRVVECADEADLHFDAHGVGVSWERSVNDLYRLFAMALMGDVESMAPRHQAAFSDALRRDDPLAQNACRSGYSALLWLYQGRLELARREAEHALDADRWSTDETAALPWPEGGYRTPDYNNVLARTHIHVYADGEAREAYRHVAMAWPHLDRAMFLTIRFVGVDLRYLLGRAALAAREELLERGPAEGWPPPWSASALETQARAQARRLARSKQACARAYSHALGAGLPEVSPNDRREALGRAAEAFAAMRMGKHVEATRHWLGEPGCSVAVARMLVPGPPSRGR